MEPCIPEQSGHSPPGPSIVERLTQLTRWFRPPILADCCCHTSVASPHTLVSNDCESDQRPSTGEEIVFTRIMLVTPLHCPDWMPKQVINLGEVDENRD